MISRGYFARIKTPCLQKDHLNNNKKKKKGFYSIHIEALLKIFFSEVVNSQKLLSAPLKVHGDSLTDLKNN